MLNKYQDPVSCDFNFEKCTTLVISGGGFKGVYYMGAAHAIGVGAIQNYVGTSCGAAIVTLLSAGATPLQIFKRIVKKRESLGTCNDIISSRIKARLRDIHNPSRIDGVASIVAMANMFIGQGVSGFLREFARFMEDLGHDKDITLQQLRDATGKKLAIIATEIPSMRQVVFTADTSPDLSVVQAVSYSCAITWPHKHNGKYYMDGVYANNFAVDVALTLWPKDNCACICSENTTYTNRVRSMHGDNRCKFVIIPLESSCGNGIFADNALMFVMFHFAFMFITNNRIKSKSGETTRSSSSSYGKR